MVLMPSVEQKIENNDATFMQIDAVKLSIAFKIAFIVVLDLGEILIFSIDISQASFCLFSIISQSNILQK